ncbi:Phosphatidylinositol kinase (PIK-H1) [Plasmopara halstedii]|uniref:Phosphatidylinositol kinase (PIK-H1) n=1 Tax=Plasmopara halstedii TaxID=4781 RepID=A0A0P1AZT1_PLAHL|nr:Phosphatidylinositol kinase (PIK-H1) [Plasmopara halstedii]CEG47360.1 Phosphatidylinositol kinase (PIK-H1) [Plasmopara halstedii]|eukprot:XP_024583729.1 Phosphatidylinositol kinase (PIK-H1) [Plasmopara halstedii]
MTSTTNLPELSLSPETLTPSRFSIALRIPSPTQPKLLPTPKVTEIVAQDGSVDIQLFIISLWKYRTNVSFSAELCQRLCSVPITKLLLDQVEFYLPQLAHMVMHLDCEVPTDDIEQFMLLLAQSSVHLALQLFWVIYATLDENRPKTVSSNPRTFSRCARLLLALEQCFVYGSPASRQASELLNRQSISRDEMEQILMADRRFFAAQQRSTDLNSAGNTVENVAPISGGWLFKKGGGTSRMGRRNWTMRWCRLEQRILLVFKKPTHTRPRAAIPLHGAQLHIVENKRPFYFEINLRFSETKAKFSAATADELATWVAYLRKASVLPDPPAGSPKKGRCTLERTLARMSFAMRTFIVQSSSPTPQYIVDTFAFSSQSGSPSKANIVSRSADAIADIETAHVEQRRSRMLSSGCASAYSSQAGDTDVSQYSTTDLSCDTDALMQALMTPDQQRRYEFFCTMINFVKSITDISESLRHVEPLKRKEQLGPLLKQLQIPSRAYIPLCKSTDPYCNVMTVFCDEGHVFSTHERAPCLIYVGAEEDENSEDVSTALFRNLYDTRADDIHVDETFFDKDAFDISTRQKRRLYSSIKSCQMSPFLRKLLSNDHRKALIEHTFGELTFSKAERLFSSVQSSNPKRWRLTSLLSKSHDDLRQELLVMQFISYFQQIFEEEKLPLRLHPYRILATGSSTGLIEVVCNAMSLDGIKKRKGFTNLRSHFEQMYGHVFNDSQDSHEETDLLQQAKMNFMHSLAAYSIVCYILAIKDRHNGNIMLDIEGFLIHIDFGFFLGRAPGGSFSFETAPFKLTAEMVDVLDGRDSTNFKYFTDLCVQGALAAQKHGGTAGPLSGLKERLFLNMPPEKVPSTIQNMVQRSYDHFGTTKYDQFQTFSNGISK